MSTFTNGQRPRKPHRRPEEIAQILADYESCGLSQAAFVAQRGIALSTFQLWRRKARQGTLPVATHTATPSFLEVLAEPNGNDGCFELEFSDGLRLRIPPHFQAQSLKTLLGFLHPLSSSCSR